MERSEKYEAWAKKYEDKLPNLAKAFRSKDLQDTIADIEKYDGWVRCITSFPKKGELVLVTNGTDVWMGQVEHEERKGAMPFAAWSLVYDGAPPFKSTEVVAWQYLPTVLPELFNK